MDHRLMRLEQNYFAIKGDLRRTLMKEMYESQLKIKDAIDKGEQNIERLESLRKKLQDSQMGMESWHYADLFDKQCVELEQERERIATCAVLKEYLKIMTLSYLTKNALIIFKLLCLEDSPETFNAAIIGELCDLRTFHYQFQGQLQKFHEVLLNESKANRNTVDVCRGFVSQVKETMDHDIMLGLCEVFPAALENGDLSAIRSFVADTDVLTAELSLIENGSKLQIENKDLKELIAPSTQEVYFDFLKENLFQTKTVILLIIIAWIFCFCL
ncbi:hypothetical protein CAEBREN_10852 [Caenorhabditis brenneri]|uniref:Uncharacterized protein n=1 Tax=Caenorhabditis brenneri TaxID=135651 RepID=G0M947_CAEBE|nr:hypothetical protein CAEBREN_10852 [Caenorhabditis brenneri]